MPHRKRATSQQVAKLAGVSRSTVSFILNNVTGMSFNEETRQRVLAAAEELGYVPNSAAKMLVSGTTSTIAFVVSHAEHLAVDAFIPQLLYALSEHSHAYGYRVLLETVGDVAKDDAYLHLVREQRIDGLVVINARSDDTQLPEVARKNFPMVLIGFPENVELGKRSSIVKTNGVAAAYNATEHLIKLGHERIAHITFSPEHYYATQDRHLGYSQALNAHNLRDDPNLLERGNYSAASGHAAMQKLLKRKHLPTALFAGNDTVAIGALAAITQHGLRVPEDIALVGYDDIPTAPYQVPPLTTVRSSATEHGLVAIKMLSRLIHDGQAGTHEIIETPLVVRESCGQKQHERATSPRRNVVTAR